MTAKIPQLIPMGGLWVPAVNQVLNTDSPSWSGYNIRIVFPISFYPPTFTTLGKAVRLMLVAAVATSGYSVDGAYMGHAASSGDVYDFDGTQVPVTVGGSTSWSVGTGNTTFTDVIDYPFDPTKNFITAFHFNAVSTVRGAATSGISHYYKSAANETGVSNVTTYTSGINFARLVSRVEVRL